MQTSLLHVYARALTLLGPERKLGTWLAVANFALAGAMFAEPVLFGRIIDELAGAQARGTTAAWPDLIRLIGAWVAFGLFTIVVGVTVALYADRLAHRRRQAVLTDFFDHVLQLPLTFHGESHSGRLMKVMLAGTDALWMLWLDFFRDSFAAAASLVVLLPFALYLNQPLGLMLLSVAVVFAILTTLVINKTETLQRTVERHYSNLAERASDTLGNVALVQGFARVEAEVTGLRTIADDLLAAQIPVLSWWAVVAVLTRASTTLTMLAIFVVGVTLHFDGRATIGDIVMFMNFAGLLIGQLEKFVRFINRVFMDAPRLQEFFNVLDTESVVREAPDAVDPGRMRGLVEFKNVSFSYDGKRPAVLDLSFTALPGETIAIVGGTGAGKSTALALLHRAFDPQTGQIQIDGMNIRAVKLAGLRRNIGVVYQESLLLNRSVADNLRVGKPDATEAEMRDAATRAQALDFIERAPDTFSTPVGERGRSLSGGERQRLSIARAILKDPPILILDEATSALDAETERKVQAALDEVMKNRTTFVIAHRLSTVRNATRILVFEHGRIIETGTFDELVRIGGRFAALAKAQFMTTETLAPQPVSQRVET
ncbi:MAG TPA: glucan ABC transporter ATP-binding protein/ permease [Xanthobacteraceae bacterium]|jgi:ATP-binding cassette, subfamily B, beta-glucan exporter|nr:glucan ABC transporter ATP-binding protein/ permease [Xanthobacteraceae bacterium]